MISILYAYSCAGDIGGGVGGSCGSNGDGSSGGGGSGNGVRGSSGSIGSAGSGSRSGGGSAGGTQRRSSIVVIPPMQICPGDLLVYSKVLTQRSSVLGKQRSPIYVFFPLFFCPLQTPCLWRSCEFAPLRGGWKWSMGGVGYSSDLKNGADSWS